MNVRLGAQIFSQSAHTAMLIYMTMYPEKFPENDRIRRNLFRHGYVI